MRIRTLVTLSVLNAGFAAGLLVLGLLIWRSDPMPIEQRRAVSWDPAESLDAGQPGAKSPVVSLVEALSRPLFQRTRRPFVPEAMPVDPPPNLEETVEAAPPPPVVDSSQLMLKGVLKLPGRTQALISTANNPDGVWIELGATVDGWTVKSLDQDSVALVSGETEIQLKLYVDKPLN